ncbi:MAG TPA: hypothetical protein V6D22_25775 [Candidatus Obscuribacterales bacterium]
MKARVIPYLLVALVVAPVPALADGTPVIHIVSPPPDVHVSDYPILVKTTVDNFTIAPPVQYWDRVIGKDRVTGHIHYTLDDGPIFASEKMQWLLEKPLDKSLPPGKHILRAELVTPNHEPLNPPIFAEVNIICDGKKEKTGASGEVGVPIDARGRDQLQKLEDEVQGLQKEISQLKGQLRDAK